MNKYNTKATVLNSKRAKYALKLHKNVPADWYISSIKDNIFQRYWHKRRFDEITKHIRNVKGVILDIGCADGTFTKVILDKSKAKKIFGIDVSDKAIGFASKYYKDIKSLVFGTAEAHKLPFKNNYFDSVFCLETLEHLEDPKIALKEMKRVLKKSGSLFVIVPIESMLFKVIWFFWTKWRGRIWDGTHINHHTDDDMVKVIQTIGFKIDIEHKFILGMLHLIKATKPNGNQ